jgi:hypothetical protein
LHFHPRSYFSRFLFLPPARSPLRQKWLRGRKILRLAAFRIWAGGEKDTKQGKNGSFCRRKSLSAAPNDVNFTPREV